MLCFEADGFKKLCDAILQFITADVDFLNFKDFRETAKDRITGVKGRIGILENLII